MQNILSLRQDFKDTISGLASVQQQTEATSPPPEEATEGNIEEDPYKSNLVLMRVQRLLLPLLLKDEILQRDFWASNVDSAAVGAALHSIVMNRRQQPPKCQRLQIQKKALLCFQH